MTKAETVKHEAATRRGGMFYSAAEALAERHDARQWARPCPIPHGHPVLKSVDSYIDAAHAQFRVAFALENQS